MELIKDLMIPIAGGTIDMRDDRIKTKWSAEIAPFSMAKFPVTQELYQAVMNISPSTFKGKNLPVEMVNWYDAITFCNHLSIQMGLTPYYNINTDNNEATLNTEANGFRLPTEAEWQYACQAGIPKPRFGELNEIAWYKDNSENSSQPVGQKQPNDWGLYDMLGNVWEWCSDIYDETVYGTYRVFRGGGWCDQERGVLATNRRRSHPVSFKIDDLGFRIAQNIR